MNFEGEYNRDFKQLIQLLNKILKDYTSKQKETLAQSLPKRSQQPINVNIVFFPISLLTPEELDELEDWLDTAVAEEDRDPEDMSSDLSASDEDFLKRHGIRF